MTPKEAEEAIGAAIAQSGVQEDLFSLLWRAVAEVGEQQSAAELLAAKSLPRSIRDLEPPSGVVRVFIGSRLVAVNPVVHPHLAAELRVIAQQAPEQVQELRGDGPVTP